MFVSRPRPHGPKVLLGLDIRKSGLLHQCLENGSGTRVQAAFSRGHEEQFVEVFGSVILGKGVVRRLPFQVEINVFNPSAWLGVPDKDGNQLMWLQFATFTDEWTPQELHVLLMSLVVQRV